MAETARGVSYDTRRKRWRAFATYKGHYIDGGFYIEKATAQAARAHLIYRLRGKGSSPDFDTVLLPPATKCFLLTHGTVYQVGP